MMDDVENVGIERGIYLAAGVPRRFAPLALESGSGDKDLLADALHGILTDDEFDELVGTLQSLQAGFTRTDTGGDR